ncbi:hypothetical protein THIOKS11520007 [Thiocapsa sp. KS1]|nr:hypothetical protein [Thiocapsa sp. KS1]CRI63751.1 hypothetical protein THIOKS11520007 [Thiocapsa sp. KS1]
MRDALQAARDTIDHVLGSTARRAGAIHPDDFRADRLYLDGAAFFASSMGATGAAELFGRTAKALYAVPFGADPRPAYTAVLADLKA